MNGVLTCILMADVFWDNNCVYLPWNELYVTSESSRSNFSLNYMVMERNYCVSSSIAMASGKREREKKGLQI